MKRNPFDAPAPARPLAPVFTLLAVGTALWAILAGCGGKQQSSSTNGSAASTATSAQPAAGTTQTAAGAGGGDLGARVYAQRCALCHGPAGKGDGPAAAGLNPKPRNHTDGAYMNSRTDEQLLAVIRNGKGGMPAWGKILSDEEIHAVLKHVRSLAK